MLKDKFKIHACWFDKECRDIGVPAFTYITLFGWTFRFNPIYDRSSLTVGFFGKPQWSWKVFQVISKKR